MCDYCGCRSHPQIAALSADHEVVLSLLGDLRRAVEETEAGRARALMLQLHEVLDAHASREERGLFTQLRLADVGDDYVVAFEREHEEVHRLLGTSAGDEWRQAAQELIHVLGEHIVREESDLFPAAHQLLTPAQWAAVDAADTQGQVTRRGDHAG